MLRAIPVSSLNFETRLAAAMLIFTTTAMASTPPQHFEDWRSEPVLQNVDDHSGAFSSDMIAAALDDTKQHAAGVWRTGEDVATEPWQGGMDNTATGKAAAEWGGALFAQASSSAPSGLICSGAVGVGGCWKEFANREGCYRWIIRSNAEESFTWSGECTDSIASGTGVMEHNYQHSWINRPIATTKEGTLVNGLEEGHWVERWTVDNSWGGVSEGSLEGGRRQGHWVTRRDDGRVEEGAFVDDWKHGHWVYSEDGRIVEEGPYVNGSRDGHWKLYGPDGTVEEGTMGFGHTKEGDWIVRKADGSVYTETYSDGELLETRESAFDVAATEDVSGDMADTSSAEQQASDDSVAAADTSSAETQPAQASEVLPSTDICVEAEEVYGPYEGWVQVVVTNGCPAPVLILYMGRDYHSDGVAYQTYLGPSMSFMSGAQGETFEERLVETMQNEELCEQVEDMPSCWTDILQPGQHTVRAERPADRRFDWAVCAQYHPLSLDAAAGPRECDVNPAFFLPTNNEETYPLLFCPESRTLESCFRGR